MGKPAGKSPETAPSLSFSIVAVPIVSGTQVQDCSEDPACNSPAGVQHNNTETTQPRRPTPQKREEEIQSNPQLLFSS